MFFTFNFNSDDDDGGGGWFTCNVCRCYIFLFYRSKIYYLSCLYQWVVGILFSNIVKGIYSLFHFILFYSFIIKYYFGRIFIYVFVPCFFLIFTVNCRYCHCTVVPNHEMFVIGPAGCLLFS